MNDELDRTPFLAELNAMIEAPHPEFRVEEFDPDVVFAAALDDFESHYAWDLELPAETNREPRPMKRAPRAPQRALRRIDRKTAA